MPYIAPEDRPALDPAIAALAAAVRERAARRDGAFEGYLNYAITRLVLEVLPERRYASIARATGVLENVKQEFYRRYAAPYEDEQSERSGDVYG
ncbi:MAG: hypothetical protein IT201_08205 [Thermoleophilia bacterium]|nr:hypothetical protein [Thermoleophilia bacterium]